MSFAMIIAAIAAMCGPRVQVNAPAGLRAEVKECQVQLVKCVKEKSKSSSVEDSMVSCMQEVK
jgi:hypothetical protein